KLKSSKVSTAKLHREADRARGWQPRRQHGGFRCHALPAIPLRQQSDVFFQLRLELQVARLVANRVPHSRPQLTKPSHDHCLYPSSRSRRSITPEIRSQSSVSLASCFKPLFVIELAFLCHSHTRKQTDDDADV